MSRIAAPFVERRMIEDRALADDTALTLTRYIESAVEVVAAYVSHNHVAADALPELIVSIHTAITKLASGEGQVAALADPADKPTATQVKRSVQPDGIVSFLDGKRYQTLKRHLSKHGFDPQSYRKRFGLPDDYPMTATSYSEKRSSLAKAFGLGARAHRGKQDIIVNQSSKKRRQAS